jgi:voltage-gated potassium channel
MDVSRQESPSYQLFMLVLCVGTIIALAAEATLKLEQETQLVLQYADYGVCALFFVDFFLSLRRAPNRWHYFRTWGWLDLVSSIPAFHLARWGRAARLVRIVRVLRSVRAARILGQLVLTRKAESAFLAVSLVAMLLIVIASLSILQFENADNSNIRTAEDALWWAMTTVTTVGYGDRYPVTAEGRAVAVVLMCAGVGLFGTFSGFLAAWLMTPEAKREEKDIDALREEVRQLRVAVERLGTANQHEIR